MATAFEKPASSGSEEKFFFRMACLMAVVIVAGFAMNLAMGRSTFAVPLVYHVHAFAIMFTSLRRTGGPFFFDQNEFMVANTLGLFSFGVLVAAALVKRRQTDWHRRLMFSGMTYLTGPGLGRLLPMPLLIPNAWRIMVLVTLIFPVIGMIADVRRTGKVHPAWYWGIASLVGMQLIAELIAYSSLGVALTHWVIDGSAGAARPMHAFLPPGMGG